MFFEVENSEFIRTIRLKAVAAVDVASVENQKTAEKNFHEICSEKTVRAVILILDFEKNQNTETKNLHQTDEKDNLTFYQSLSALIRNCPVPVILVVKSKFDFGLADAAHLCIASETAKFTLSENQHFNNSFDCKKISSQNALKLGLINKVAPLSEVEKEAYSLAKKISELAPLAIRACSKAVIHGLEMPLEDGLKLEAELFSRMFSTEDMSEGTRAFLEKRKPIFQGK